MSIWFLIFGPVAGAIFFAIMVNLMAGNFGGQNGQHRQSGAPLHSGAAQGPGQSAGGAAALANAFSRSAYSQTAQSALAQQAASYQSLKRMMDDDWLAYPASAAQKLAMYQAMQNMAMAGVGKTSSGPPHKPTTLKSEGMRCGEIIAWRAWHVHEENLLSVVADGKVWSATEPMEGDAAAGYGVHAYKGPHGPLLDEYVAKNSGKLWVIGEIAMWGDIIEHEEGYRSQFARVHSLVTWHEKVTPFHRKLLCEKYLKQPEYKIEDAA